MMLPAGEELMPKTFLLLADAYNGGKNPEGIADPGMLDFRKAARRSLARRT